MIEELFEDKKKVTKPKDGGPSSNEPVEPEKP
jgi:hypothetical protein